jgi:undecaprenyl-diphosphatase
VGLARLYRGMHYPTDVLAGALLGMLWLTISAIVVLRRPRQ